VSPGAVHLIVMAPPGPNVLLVAQAAMSCSRRAALAVAARVASSATVMATVAGLDLGVVFEHVAGLHDAIRLVGGVCLVFLAVQTWRHAGDPLTVSITSSRRSPWRDCRRGDTRAKQVIDRGVGAALVALGTRLAVAR
jgi:threonine/homoserine/homoserine lactone efflux protein